MKKVKTHPQIAPWKIDNSIERMLASKADKSECWKKVYAWFYKVFDGEYYKKGLKLIERQLSTFVGDVSAKEKKKYIADMVYSLHRFGCAFDEYFLFGFPALNARGRETFLTDKGRWEYYGKLNDLEANKIFADKKMTYDKFQKFYKRDVILVIDDKDREAFQEFTSKHKRFIVKPYNSSGGRGVHMQTVDETNWEETFRELVAEKGGVVCEEVIVQSAIMASFHPASVNTVRIPTIRTKEGVKLFYPFLRTGCGGNVVDNAFSNGLFALVDSETGIIMTEAVSKNGKFSMKHPESGVVYPGFQIPDWQQAVQLVNELSAVIPENRYVGWDVAHTEQGWIMVEGNSGGQFVQQFIMRNGIKAEMEEIVRKL